MTDDMLTDTLRSVRELYDAHGLTLDIPTARRMFNEETGELQEASSHLHLLDMLYRPQSVIITDKREQVTDEAADAFFTLAGLLEACGITPEEFAAAVVEKCRRNDAKRPDNGYAAINGKVQKTVVLP